MRASGTCVGTLRRILMSAGLCASRTFIIRRQAMGTRPRDCWGGMTVMTRQFTRWAIVGLVTNAILYLVYLALTRSLMKPQVAMSVVYLIGVALGFAGNRSWTFEHSGRADAALARYVMAYAIGYLVNLAGLQLGVTVCHLRHEIVQGAMIFVVAALTFLLQKYFVFADSSDSSRTGAGREP